MNSPIHRARRRRITRPPKLAGAVRCSSADSAVVRLLRAIRRSAGRCTTPRPDRNRCAGCTVVCAANHAGIFARSHGRNCGYNGGHDRPNRDRRAGNFDRNRSDRGRRPATNPGLQPGAGADPG